MRITPRRAWSILAAAAAAAGHGALLVVAGAVAPLLAAGLPAALLALGLVAGARLAGAGVQGQCHLGRQRAQENGGGEAAEGAVLLVALHLPPEDPPQELLLRIRWQRLAAILHLGKGETCLGVVELVTHLPCAFGCGEEEESIASLLLVAGASMKRSAPVQVDAVHGGVLEGGVPAQEAQGASEAALRGQLLGLVQDFVCPVGSC
mmetsp:Transcript_92018/g.274617  ORF Transcript_92018/g.274617 Transcript_92018/m.274617 type:complete len:206 (-) Transcript_92018:287-904(-)